MDRTHAQPGVWWHRPRIHIHSTTLPPPTCTLLHAPSRCLAARRAPRAGAARGSPGVWQHHTPRLLPRPPVLRSHNTNQCLPRTPTPPSAQVIVLHAENPWGNKFGNIPAVLFGYIGDDGVLDFAVCGNPLYANFFLNPDTARAPPTAPTLKVRPGGTLVGGPCCMWPHPLTSTDFQGCHLPALGFLMLLYAFLRVPAPRHTPLQTDTLPSLPSSLARPPPLPPANKPPNCAGNLHQRSV